MIALNAPVRIGQTAHHYLALQFKKDREVKIKINLDQEQIDNQFGGDLASELEGPLFDVLSRLLKNLCGISVVIPDGFKSHKDAEAVKCSCKAQDGYLYPLTTAFLFIHKPVSYIKHSDISQIELLRIQEFLQSTGRTFDLTIVSKKGESITLCGIDKDEYQNLLGYFREKKLRVRNMDDDGKVMDLTEQMEMKPGRGPVADVEMAEGEDDDMDEEDDESFEDDSEQQDDSDESFDDEDDAAKTSPKKAESKSTEENAPSKKPSKKDESKPSKKPEESKGSKKPEGESSKKATGSKKDK